MPPVRVCVCVCPFPAMGSAGVYSTYERYTSSAIIGFFITASKAIKATDCGLKSLKIMSPMKLFPFKTDYLRCASNSAQRMNTNVSLCSQ